MTVVDVSTLSWTVWHWKFGSRHISEGYDKLIYLVFAACRIIKPRIIFSFLFGVSSFFIRDILIYCPSQFIGIGLL
jgi:hypothetical protein